MNLKEILLKKGIVKIRKKGEEPFILKSGQKSKLFIDIKEASLDPAVLKEIIKEMLTYSTYTGYDRIASVAIGGIPIATALSLETGIPQIIVRQEKHNRGTLSQVIGECKGKNCVLVEDIATTGTTIMNAVTALEIAGAICNEVIVIVDREEGARELCKKNKVKLRSVLRKSDFGITEET